MSYSQMAGTDAPYLFKDFDPADWRELICCELSTLLGSLLEEDANRVVRIGYTNIKAPGTVAILEHAPSDVALARIRTIAKTMPGINFVSGGIGCANHYCELDWSAPEPSRPGLIRRIAFWFAARFG